jgi:hypothetical protein
MVILRRSERAGGGRAAGGKVMAVKWTKADIIKAVQEELEGEGETKKPTVRAIDDKTEG